MIKILTLLLALTTSAFAQSGSTIKQSGAVTPTHAACWTTNGIVQDCGTAAIPYLTTIGTVGQGPTICAWTALITSGAAQSICLGGTTAGGAEIYVQNYGTASALPLLLDLNGSIYTFPYTVGGIVGPSTTVVGDLVLWNNVTGTLVKDSNVLPSSTTATTQTTGDNSTKVATDAFVQASLPIIPTGIDTANLGNGGNPATTNYSIATTDCSTTILAGTGSTGQFTLTLPAVSGFATNCPVLIKNGDTGRGKILSGFPSDVGSTLEPLQSIGVKIVNGTWQAFYKPDRWQPTSNVAFYVLSGGSDSNDGLANTTAGAFATCGGAIAAISQYVDFSSGITATINIPGSATSGCAVNGLWAGAPTQSPQGVPVIVNCDGTGSFSLAGTSAAVSAVQRGIIAVEGCTFNVPSGGTALFDDWQGQIVLLGTNSIIGTSASTGIHVSGGGSYLLASSGVTLNLSGSYTNDPLEVENNAVMGFEGASIVINGNISYNRFFTAQGGSIGFFGGTTITNPGSFTTTGARCVLQNGGHVQSQLDNGNLTYFPGNSACVIQTGGYYDNLWPSQTSSVPGNPTGTTNTSGVMMGLAGSISTNDSYNVRFDTRFDLTNSTMSDGCTAQIYYGTGTAPANGVTIATAISSYGAVAISSTTQIVAPNSSTNFPASLFGVVGPNSPGLTFWYDVGLTAITGGTCNIYNVSMIATEN